jgi:transposase
MSVTDDAGSGRVVTVGVDWAKDNHAVCVLDGDGEPVARLVVAHSRAGLGRLVELLGRFEVLGVGIERPDGPLVDTLLAAGVAIFVIAPAQVKSLRRRYGSAGNKDDRFDAFVLADTVRTDRRRLMALIPDTTASITLRTLGRARKDLLRHRDVMTNQLRARLDTALPGLVGLFGALHAPTSRAFIAEFTTQEAVERLDVDELAAWLKAHHSQRCDPVKLHRHLAHAPRGAIGVHGVALAGITRAYLTALNALIEQITVLEQQISDALDSHPDRQIFTSLPRAGTIRAARLLAEIGDARGRFRRSDNAVPNSASNLLGRAQRGRSRRAIRPAGHGLTPFPRPLRIWRHPSSTATVPASVPRAACASPHSDRAAARRKRRQPRDGSPSRRRVRVGVCRGTGFSHCRWVWLTLWCHRRGRSVRPDLIALR